MNRSARPPLRAGMHALATNTVRGAAAALVFCLPCTAQLAPGGIFDPDWETLPNGGLAFQPNPAFGGRGLTPCALLGPMTGDPRTGELLWDRLACSLTDHAHAWLTLLAPGREDLASTADVERQLRAQGLVDADGLATLTMGDTPGAPFRAGNPHLDRLMALRALARRDDPRAREAAEIVQHDRKAPPWLRRAAHEVAAQFGGRAFTAVPADRVPLADRLASVPDDTAWVLVCDNARLPPTGIVAPHLRTRRERDILWEIGQAGGKVSEAQLAGGQFLADGPVLLGPELARRFGNARIERSVLALRSTPQKGFCCWLDGAFDLRAIDAALTREKVERQGPDAGVVEFASVVQGRVTANTLELS